MMRTKDKINLVAICGVAVCLFLLVECKPAAQSPGPLTAAEESPEPQTSPLELPVPRETPMSSPQGVSSSVASPAPAEADEQLVSVEQSYFASDPQSRVELIGKVTDSAGEAAVDALGRLFHGESDTDVKLALLAAVMAQEGQPAQQLAVFASGSSSLQPESVRLAAIQGLSALRTPAAIQMLKGLRLDADGGIRAAAEGALVRDAGSLISR